MRHRPPPRLRPLRASLFAAACLLLAAACSAAPVMQPNPSGELAADEPRRPTQPVEAPVELGPEAFDACTDREQGASCWVFVGDSSVNGDCAPADSGRLACQASR